MTNEEYYKKYINEHCNKCENRKTDLCEIRISKINNNVEAKCIYYKEQNGKEE